MEARHYLYVWREEGPIEPAADSLLDRLAADRNLPGVERLSLAEAKKVFRRHFPRIRVGECEMEWESADDSFRVSFTFDDRNQPTSICISSEIALNEIPETFTRIFDVVREIGCTRIESAVR